MKKILDIYKNKESYNLKNRSLGFGNSADRFFIKKVRLMHYYIFLFLEALLVYFS